MDQMKTLTATLFAVFVGIGSAQAQVVCHGCQPCTATSPLPTGTPPPPTFTPTITPTVNPSFTATDTPTSTPTGTPPTPTPTPTAGPLKHANDFQYLGQFILSMGNCNISGCGSGCAQYSLANIAYRESDHHMFQSLHPTGCPMGIAEYGAIPDVFTGQTVNMVNGYWGLATASPVMTNTQIYGLMWDNANNRMCYSNQLYYNQGFDLTDLGCIHSTGNPATETVDGPWELGGVGVVSGAITKEDNGKFLMGANAGDAIATNSTCTGPCAYEVDVTGSPPATPVAATQLMYHYTASSAPDDTDPADIRETMSGQTPTSELGYAAYLKSMPGLHFNGMEVIPGSRTLVVAYSEGKNRCYGAPCSGDTSGIQCQQRDGTATFVGNNFQDVFGYVDGGCAGKGQHDEHFYQYFYLYDLNDLELVRQHAKLASDVHPYEYVPLTTNTGLDAIFRGMSIDTVNHRLFIASNNNLPVYTYGQTTVYVFHYN